MKKGIYILLSVFVLACGKGGEPGPDPTPNPPTPVVPSPIASVLSLPANNEACTVGTIVSSTENTVPFSWKAAENAESYEITVKNLDLGTSVTQTTTALTLTVTLKRNTAYSWFITSKSGKTTSTSKSEVWKFYNSGPGVSSYAPFPAEIISPLMDASITATGNKLSLDWVGSDADNDVANYDIYMGTTSTPSLLKANEKESVLNDVPVTVSTTYYWKVITRDSKGNTSDSGLYKFRVN